MIKIRIKIYSLFLLVISICLINCNHKPIPKTKTLTEKKIFKEKTPTIKPRRVRRKDGNFIAYDNDVVSDTKTSLEWFVGPDKNTNWNEYEKWIENLDVDGGGWRMPTRDELKSLYKKGAGKRNMTSLLKTTGRFVWSGQTKGSSGAWGFNFFNESEDWHGRRTSSGNRVFAVRSAKEQTDRDQQSSQIAENLAGKQ